MTSFDTPGIFHQERVFTNEGGQSHESGILVEFRSLVSSYRQFIREFSVGGFALIYREQLKKNFNLRENFLEISFSHLQQFDEESAMKLHRYPARYLPALEEAAKLVANEIIEHEGLSITVSEMQVLFSMDDTALSIREMKSSLVSQLMKISGIIVAASQVRSKATKLTLQCRTCLHTINNIELKPGLDGYMLPRTCAGSQISQLQRCPVDPYHIVPDKCDCVDYQILKLQENPEDVPHGEMPRHMQLYCDKYLTDRVSPGNRVSVVGVFSIKKVFRRQKASDQSMSGIRTPYLRVLGIHVEMSGRGHMSKLNLTADDEIAIKEFAKKPMVLERITRSIAPSIYGAMDIKKAIACLLFSGSRKRLPDGLTRRGDINVLLLGDPGTAKSQLLKFVEKVAPIGVYTSGKGSSAAGLTASIIRDPQSRSFIMEGGAMVLADGGVVCIDEFDKMREDDRVAIHEAMEQQTISIAKAGITTTLNSRCSVLAAANSVFGRWDDTKGDENIDFMPTILSRFDMIFIVKDTHDVARDTILAKHVISVHVNASLNVSQVGEDVEGDLSVEFLKKYIAYCREHCAPRLSDTAGDKLAHNYVRMRNPPTDPAQKQSKHRPPAIPITVRQLEAIIRMSEALAKMELSHFAHERHIDEALRLFQVSTIEAAASGNLAGVEGFTTVEDREAYIRIEKQLRKRFALGTHVSEYLILQDFIRQNYPEILVRNVIQSLVRRGDLQYRMQRKMLYRVK